MELTLSKYVNLIRTVEGNAVFINVVSIRWTSFQIWMLKTIQLLYLVQLSYEKLLFMPDI